MCTWNIIRQIRRGEPLTILSSYNNLLFCYLLLKSNEVKSSYHMEKEGLIRGVQFIEGKGLQIGELVTDRHVQIVKHVREQMPNTIHHFDVWHVAKGKLMCKNYYQFSIPSPKTGCTF